MRDLVTDLRERGAGESGVVKGLLGNAAAEIARLRGEYEKDGVVDPWTGEWCKDGKVSEPVATLDAAGRVVPAVDDAGTPLVATHALGADGVVREVKPVRVGGGVPGDRVTHAASGPRGARDAGGRGVHEGDRDAQGSSGVEGRPGRGEGALVGDRVEGDAATARGRDVPGTHRGNR